MFKISSEFKKIPSWFENFNKEKLYIHPVKSIQYLIWVMQCGCLISLFFTTSLIGGFFGFQAFMHLFIAMMGAIALTQVMILGIQVRSPLAWLFMASTSFWYTFSVLLPMGLIIFYFLDQDEVTEYFSRKEAINSAPITETCS